MSTAQKGRNDLKLASLRRDRELVDWPARSRSSWSTATRCSTATRPARRGPPAFSEDDEDFLFKS